MQHAARANDKSHAAGRLQFFDPVDVATSPLFIHAS
jgi:hypothetical protein